MSDARYKTARWRRVREQAMERGRYRCEHCGYRQGATLPDGKTITLVCHHRDELGFDGPRAYDLDNIGVLCRGCHQIEHGYLPRPS